MPSLLVTFWPSLLVTFWPSLLVTFWPSLLVTFWPSLLVTFWPSLLVTFWPSLMVTFPSVDSKCAEEPCFHNVGEPAVQHQETGDPGPVDGRQGHEAEEMGRR